MTQDAHGFDFKHVDALLQPHGHLTDKNETVKDVLTLDNSSEKVVFPDTTVSNDEIILPSEFDVLCGRERTSFRHSGNKHFRAIIEEHRVRYQEEHARERKTLIVNEIMGVISETKPGGRFLKQNPKTKLWHIVSKKYAHEKVSHALRSAKDPNRPKPRPKKRPPMRRKLPPPTEEEEVMFHELLADQQSIFEALVHETGGDLQEEELPIQANTMDLLQGHYDQHQVYDEWCTGRFIMI